MANHRGYAYLLLLLLIAVLGAASSAAVSLGATMARRDAERQLLVIGAEFQRALTSYSGTAVANTSVSGGAGPRELEELLKDPRVPGMRRHLRKVFIDPMTGRDSWGLVRNPQGAIVGIHSLAPGVPLQRTGFESRWSAFEQAASYRNWVFGVPADRMAPFPPAAAKPKPAL